jgi:hypothetical protein
VSVFKPKSSYLQKVPRGKIKTYCTLQQIQYSLKELYFYSFYFYVLERQRNNLLSINTAEIREILDSMAIPTFLGVLHALA